MSVPAGWFLVLSVVACVGAAGWLGFTLVDPSAASADNAQASDSPSASDAPSSPAATTADPTEAPESAATTPSPEPASTESASTEPPVKRESPVSVLNNTGIVNLAKTFSIKVSGAGWTVSGLGNWRGQIETNTVYYPDRLKDQADLLAADVGIERVLPSIVPMRMDRLTIILSGPQQ